MVNSATFVIFLATHFIFGEGATHKDRCIDRCGFDYDSRYDCHCNSQCETFGNCCSDYWTICKAGGVVHTHHPQVVTVLPLGKYTGSETGIAQQLWDADVNRFGPADLKINLQGHTGRGPGSDHATSKLFTYVNVRKLQSPTYKTLLALWDNYHTSESQHESTTAQHQNEINAFLDAVMNTKVMQLAYSYLTTFKHFIGDQHAFKAKLQQLWFALYSRSSNGPKNSCGFEHIFLGEFKGSSVSGFHNWVRFYKLESSGRIDYKGYINKKEPFLIEFTFTWDGKWKPISSFFIGTSPEFDMALSTICMLTAPNRACKYTIQGQHFRIQTYDNTHVSGLQVASAYPEM
ncbi:hypothetical protein LOTGIDRAFT_220728 [Lottia gigantea]|uniref:Uridylate-specific endoribonuclease n=1 Tax=Lottia gigantea TaxID=225164 RepID=V3ZZL2_LOTGI|nr:hypothetical protein LOTGIDRAFT_220728 [Lottia gigantea]ESO86431.1 hypothetical protein LOTGIDRAFT_220728 [Lottia gigantea]